MFTYPNSIVIGKVTVITEKRENSDAIKEVTSKGRDVPSLTNFTDFSCVLQSYIPNLS